MRRIDATLNQVSASNQAAPKRRRGPGKPWKPGESGNPSGRRLEIVPAIVECRRLALVHAPHAIARLAAMLDSKDERVVVAAAEGLLDRAGLRPYALEPERLELIATVDVDALRSTLAARVSALCERPALPAHRGDGGAGVGQGTGMDGVPQEQAQPSPRHGE